MEPTLAMEAEDVQLQNTVIMAYAAQPLGETESHHGFGEIGEQRDGIKSPPAEFSHVFDDSTHSLVDPATTTDSESPKQDLVPVMPAGEPEPSPGSANPLQPQACNQFAGEAQPGSRSPSKQAADEHSATKIDGDNMDTHQLPAGETEKVISSHTISHPESSNETAITYEVSEYTGVVVERGKPRTPRPDSLFSSTDNTDMDEVSEFHDSDTVDQLSAYDTNAGTDSNIFIKLFDTSGMKRDLEIDEVDEAIPANAEDVMYMVSEDTGVVVERARHVSTTSRFQENEEDELEERHGHGRAVLPNGDKYKGIYEHGKRSGFFMFNEKKVRFMGQYIESKKQGFRHFIYPDGSVYSATVDQAPEDWASRDDETRQVTVKPVQKWNALKITEAMLDTTASNLNEDSLRHNTEDCNQLAACFIAGAAAEAHLEADAQVVEELLATKAMRAAEEALEESAISAPKNSYVGSLGLQPTADTVQHPKILSKSQLRMIDFSSLLGQRVRALMGNPELKCNFELPHDDVAGGPNNYHHKYPITYRPKFRKNRQQIDKHCHTFKFDKQDRKEFCSQFDSGLNAASWHQAKCMNRCWVSLDKDVELDLLASSHSSTTTQPFTEELGGDLETGNKQKVGAETENSKYQCTYCHKTLTRKHDLHRHMQRHSGKHVFQCSTCQLKFTTAKDVNKHAVVHNPTRLHCCSQCPKKFSSKYYLQQHMGRHAGKTPFVCEECGNGFVHNKHLQEHMVSHSEERPYKCTLCLSRFNRRSSLYVHMQRHEGVRQFCCAVCDKNFSTRSDLTTHMVVHQSTV